MIAYVGQTRSADFIAELRSYGIGECTNRGEWPPRRRPYFYDNGAFVDWRAKRPWRAGVWFAELQRVLADPDPPAFAVAPDVVAGGVASLRTSVMWSRAMKPLRTYLAVQDGMTSVDVEADCEAFDGLFVGGTLAWKLATSAAWVDLAHRLGGPCHIGRVGTPKRVRWAKSIGADSIDSCFPLWTRARLREFVEAVNE